MRWTLLTTSSLLALTLFVLPVSAQRASENYRIESDAISGGELGQDLSELEVSSNTRATSQASDEFAETGTQAVGYVLGGIGLVVAGSAVAFGLRDRRKRRS